MREGLWTTETTMRAAFSGLDSRLAVSPGRLGALLTLGVAFVCLLYYVSLNDRTVFVRTGGKYRSELLRTHEEHWTSCLSRTTQPDFYELEALLKTWSHTRSPTCRNLLQYFNDIYRFESRVGSVEVSDTFRTKVSKWLNGDASLLAELKHQVVFSLFNKYSHESTLFSKLRSKRPGINGAGDPLVYVNKLIKESEGSCDFCNYKEMTAFDSFGRIESKHAVAVSNVFKYEAYHGLILLKKHNPVTFNQEEFMDMMSVMVKWFRKAHNTDSRFRFPNLNWDMLPRASASQIHPHGQVALAPSHSYGLMEHIRLAGMDFASAHGNSLNYFTTLQEVHNVLGLCVNVGKATAMAYLTPKKDFEIIVMSETVNDDFFRLVYHVIRTFMDDMKLMAYSMGMYLPPVDHWSSQQSSDIPAIARIISRGSVSSTRSDISAMELFGASQVNQNPYEIIAKLRKRVSGK